MSTTTPENLLINIKVKDRDGQSHDIEARPGDSLMEALRDYHWGVAAVCGGMCSCATCHVFIAEEWRSAFPQRDVDEEDLVDMLEFEAPNSRLSCQLRLADRHDGLELELAPEE